MHDEPSDNGEPSKEPLARLAELFGSDGPPDLQDMEGPLRWSEIPASEAREEWTDLRGWVEALVARFPHLDHHVIPLCWWHHTGHVEALAALRDHERICYSDSSPATAAVDWHRAFRDIESRLREWTANLACGSTHDPRPRLQRPVDDDDWADFVAQDVQRREEAAIRRAVHHE